MTWSTRLTVNRREPAVAADAQSMPEAMSEVPYRAACSRPHPCKALG
ncbi:hypothetical protein [Streptomyces osmaniensis]|nr:hypothetical protein KJK32_14670 [Streptomyces sp. JCM17656]